MKKLIIAVGVVWALAGEGWCSTWRGVLDLNSSVQAMVLREAHDGQWLAGIAHPNLWHLDHNGNPILHAGVFQAWNAENGNASFGPLVGLDLSGVSKDIGYDVPFLLGQIGSALNVPSVFKPAQYLADLLSIDAFVGLRSVHTADVNGNLVYGGAATLRIPFTFHELQNGNMGAAK